VIEPLPILSVCDPTKLKSAFQICAAFPVSAALTTLVSTEPPFNVNVPAPSAPLFPKINDPPFNVTPPESVLAPFKLNAPLPSFVNDPPPLRADPNVTLFTPISTVATVPLPIAPNREDKSLLTPLTYCNVPPANVIVPALPIAFAVPSANTPPRNVVPPV
jgi:hypothetical protein